MVSETHDIVLATLNAKFIHSAFGLRYLHANLGDLRDRSTIIEFTIHQRPLDIVETLLSQSPKIVGLGVYIWNVVETTRVISLLKKIAPEVVVIIGGPEVSYELDDQRIVHLTDHVICGEGESQLARLCSDILSGSVPPQKIFPSIPVDIETLESPYSFYSDEDIENRIIYVEASRGCPFRCEFCLSALAKSVRQFELDSFLEKMDDLGKRGVRHFKFVDRTFNLKLDITLKILAFFRERVDQGYVAHFELVPDRLPEELREVIADFPPATLQFEVGIQTFNPAISKLISRRQNYEKLEDNFAFLRDHTHVHVHADLIAGLPGEDLVSFAKGFNRLVELRPQEIQLGILKRLRGTPIIRHTETYEMVFSEYPPYEVLSTKDVPFPEMQIMKRFARFWDLIGNSGNFIGALKYILSDDPFDSFMVFSAWLFEQTGTTYKISLARLVGFVLDYLILQGFDGHEVAQVLAEDFRRPGRRKIPKYLHPWIDKSEWSVKQDDKKTSERFSRQERFAENADTSIKDSLIAKPHS